MGMQVAKESYMRSYVELVTHWEKCRGIVYMSSRSVFHCEILYVSSKSASHCKIVYVSSRVYLPHRLTTGYIWTVRYFCAKGFVFQQPNNF